MQSSTPRNNISRLAIAWALFSQSIWMPLLFIDAYDHWSQKSSQTFSAIPRQESTFSNLLSTPHGSSSSSISIVPGKNAVLLQSQLASEKSGVVLNASQPASQLVRSTYSGASPLRYPHSPVTYIPMQQPEFSNQSISSFPGISKPPETVLSHSSSHSSGYFQRFYSRSDLLGGTITLSDLGETDMPPVAIAERARWRRSGDPLAPIPDGWRESMRGALQNLVLQTPDPSSKSSNLFAVKMARVIHVPSSKVRQSTQVPLALQSDGTVDILSHPDDPAILDEIKVWSSKQSLPSRGQITPAIVHIHPLTTAEEPARPPAPISQQTREQLKSPAPAASIAPSNSYASSASAVTTSSPEIDSSSPASNSAPGGSSAPVAVAAPLSPQPIEESSGPPPNPVTDSNQANSNPQQEMQP